MTSEAEVYEALALRVVVDQHGIRKYFNATDQLHREDGPAIEASSGDRYWYRNGKLHREDDPAVIYANGTRKWWQTGKLHRVNGPAIERYNGHTDWWLNGIPYTEQAYYAQLKALGHTT